MKQPENVIFFDGICNLCNQTVDLLIKIDRKRILKYSSLQSQFAKKVLKSQSVKAESSFVFLVGEKKYIKAEAAIHIFILLGGFYKLMGKIISIFPYKFLNIFYDFIASNRYRLFGQRKQCRLPNPKEIELFID